MINFKVGGLSDLITVLKPLGKPIQLNIGEIVKAEVMDLLPSGGVTLKVKGSFITARTDVPLQKDSAVMLKVIGTPSSPNELKLQFVGLADKEQPADLSHQSKALSNFLSELNSNLQHAQKSAAPVLTTEKIEALLKALPADIDSIPKNTKLQLQSLLQESLKSAGQNIQTRLDEVFKDLPASLKNMPDIENLKLNVNVDIDKMLSTGLKGLVSDTGVGLESKLKGVADLFQQISKETQLLQGKEAAAPDSKQILPQADKTSIDGDLKANLLKFRDVLVSRSETASPKDSAVLKSAIANVDGILRDIETFQLLSKTTESFYTFLPVSWQQLKDGEIAFKQNKGDGKSSSFSCRLTLDLDSLGKLVIMVLQHNNDLFVSFKPESSAFKTVLESNVNSLENQFAGKGLNLKGVRVLDKEDTSLDQLENLGTCRQIVSIKA